MTSSGPASITNHQAYVDVCFRAATDSAAFSGFRQDPVYAENVENVSEAIGAACLDRVMSDPVVVAGLDALRQNDAIGGPRTVAYPGVGLMAPTTVRYLKVLADLRRLFGSLDDLDMCEIGVGYGGQCRVINAVARPATYGLIDIDPALALARCYLGHFITPAILSFWTLNELPPLDYDLVISNYAFSELSRALQEAYLDKVILRAKRGYMLCNQIAPADDRSYRAEELLAAIKGARRLPEEPPSFEGNYLVVWGAI